MTLADRVLCRRLFDIEVLTSRLFYQKLRDRSFYQHSLFIAFHRDAGAQHDEGWHCIPGVQCPSSGIVLRTILQLPMNNFRTRAMYYGVFDK